MPYTLVNTQWLRWITENWSALIAGWKLEAPSWLLPMPESGFSAQPFASPDGQVADWTLSMRDESRIHVHEFADGRRIVHRDKHDPDQGILNMLAHLAFETPYVVLSGLALLLFAGTKGK